VVPTPTIGPSCDKLSKMKKWADEMVLGRSNTRSGWIRTKA
jgi:hypothetical protein